MNTNTYIDNLVEPYLSIVVDINDANELEAWSAQIFSTDHVKTLMEKIPQDVEKENIPGSFQVALVSLLNAFAVKGNIWKTQKMFVREFPGFMGGNQIVEENMRYLPIEFSVGPNTYTHMVSLSMLYGISDNPGSGELRISYNGADDSDDWIHHMREMENENVETPAEGQLEGTADYMIVAPGRSETYRYDETEALEYIQGWRTVDMWVRPNAEKPRVFKKSGEEDYAEITY